MADALKVRPGILDIAPYVGGESSLAGRSRVVRLSDVHGRWPERLAVAARSQATPPHTAPSDEPAR